MKHTMRGWGNTKYRDSFTIAVVFCENIVIVISALLPSSSIEIDTINSQLRLPSDKLQALKGEIGAWDSRRS